MKKITKGDSTMFALRSKKTGQLITFYSSANEGDFCVSVHFELVDSKYPDNVWVVTSREVAEKAAITNTEWYNASFDTPENRYVGDLEVVELVVK
jgi:hypothetical protein